jgi:hypothetical protein
LASAIFLQSKREVIKQQEVEIMELKFRAYDEATESFIYSDLIAGGMWRYFKTLEDRGIRHFESEQYIGAEDKNNKAVYRGDLLRDINKFAGAIHEVYWDDRTLCHRLRVNGEMQFDKTRFVDFVRFMEIIGNIHESKEAG